MTKSADPSVSLLARFRNIARQQGMPVDTMLPDGLTFNPADITTRDNSLK